MSQQHPKRNKDYPLDHVKAILAMSKALWGEISPPLRAARVSWDNDSVFLYFFYDGQISEEDHESAERVSTEFISSFPEYKLEVEIIRFDYPKHLPDKGELVYLRREHKPANQ